jgi:hypothetical protein
MIAKFLLTTIIVAAIWFGFRYLQRLAELKERRRTPPRGEQRQAVSDDGVQDLVRCPTCDTWRAPSACGRPDCPYGGRRGSNAHP